MKLKIKFIRVTLRESKSNSEFASLIKLFCSLRSVETLFSTCDLSFSRI